MKQVAFSGEITEYQGTVVNPARKFSGNADTFSTIDEMKQAGEYPSDGQILKMVNTKLVNAARAAAYQEQTKDLKEKYEQTPEFKIKNLVSALMAAGKNKEEAEATARAIVSA